MPHVWAMYGHADGNDSEDDDGDVRGVSHNDNDDGDDGEEADDADADADADYNADDAVIGDIDSKLTTVCFRRQGQTPRHACSQVRRNRSSKTLADGRHSKRFSMACNLQILTEIQPTKEAAKQIACEQWWVAPAFRRHSLAGERAAIGGKGSN